MIMFPFSYRTLEMTFNDFLRDNAWWIALAFAGLVLLSVALILLFNAKAKPKARVIEKSVYLEALGGEGNVLSHERKGSRIMLKMQDYEKLDSEKLKEAGVDGFILMSDRLTLVIKGDAEAVEKTLFGE
jgi:phosphotransferase system IIB component